LIDFTERFRVQAGFITFRIPDGYQLPIDALAEKNERLTVSISKPRKPRTTGPGSQSHHLNGHIQQIASHTGQSFDDVKMAIKFEARADGYSGHEVAGHWIPKSEKETSTAECAILIEVAHRIAAFLEIKLRED